MAKRTFTNDGSKREETKAPDAEAQAAVEGTTETAVTIGSDDTGGGVPMPAIGGVSGDVDKGDITLPRLELVYGVGAVSELFDAGDVVYNREVCLAKKGEPVHMTVASIRKYYMEDMPYEPDREELPRLFQTKEEVEAAGLWTEWNRNGQQKPPVADCADLLVAIECPEGVEDTMFPLSYAPDGGDPVSLAVALFTVRKTSYTRVAKPVFSARQFFLRDNLLLGRWCLTTERKKTKSGNVTTLPNFRNVGRNSPEFAKYLAEQLG